MILVDANILLYSEDQQSPYHVMAREWSEHGCELISTDTDFSRFPGIKWKNPFK